MFFDRVKQSASSTGTGPLQLTPPEPGYLSFAQAAGSGNPAYYLVVLGTQWELGWGVVTAGTPDQLTRNPLKSSNSGGLISLAATGATVACVPIAAKMPYLDQNGLPKNAGTVLTAFGALASGWSLGAIPYAAALSAGLPVAFDVMQTTAAMRALMASTSLSAALNSLGGVPLTGGVMTGNLTATGNSYAFQAIGGTQTSLGLYVEGLTANRRAWEILNSNDGSLQIRSITDNYSSASNAMTILRSPTGTGILNFHMGADVTPDTNNAYNLGIPSNLWANIYGATGTVNSSDASLKNIRGLLTESEIAAWGDIQWKIYQFIDAVAAKGADAARLHTGLIAQEVQAAFAAHGLDAAKYGLWCSDEIEITETNPVIRTLSRQKTAPVTFEKIVITDGVPVLKAVTEDQPVTAVKTVMDEAGNPVLDGAGQPVTIEVPVMEAIEIEEQVTEVTGTATRLGLRYAECLAFEAAYQRSRVAALEARVAALEATAAG